ncbi:hypothetical protein TCCBUS3UF1_4000 [Thermus sp. CCB_US3_UF1]|nr:hypothetical protein TCCBUS3UF1_4000 [Thermus sp. CCB_US3_UF1]
MRKGFTLVEAAVALLLVGAVVYMVLALSQTLRAGTATGPQEEVLQAAETLLEAGVAAPTCPTSASVTLAGKAYRICRQMAGVSLSPPSNTTLQAFTYRFEDVAQGESFFLTQISWEGSPPPPPPSPNFSASCRKVSPNRLRMEISNTGATISTKVLSLSWNGEGKRRLKEIYQGSTTLWSDNKGVKKGSQVSLSQSLTFGNATLDFTFDKNFKTGSYTFTLQLFVGQGNNQTPYTVSCSVGW